MTQLSIKRRQFIRHLATATAAVAGGIGLSGCQTSTGVMAPTEGERLFRISLAQWSLHRRFFSGAADPVDFPTIAREEFGIDAVEYVSQLYEAPTPELVQQLRQRAADAGVTNVLMMIDHQGALGAADAKARKQAVANHNRWAEVAYELGCHSVRVNAESEGSYDEQMQRVADGLVQLAEVCESMGLNVLVENHGGLSSNGQWLAGVMRTADHPKVGTLPDFGNFVINHETGEAYDRYQGVTELMPFAKAVSAKSHEFDAAGNEVRTDFFRMMKIVTDAGYHSWVGVEYEGQGRSEAEGIRLTKRLLEEVEVKLRAKA